MFTCSDDSSSTDPSGSNNNNNNNNNNNTPEIEITGQWDISETRSIADYFDKRKKNNIKSVVSTNNTLDVGIVSIDAPITGELTATETITVTIGNFGTEEASNFDLIYSIHYEGEGWQTDITETFSETIASGVTAQYNFTATSDLSQLGQWEIAATTAMESDEDTSNDVFETWVNSISYSTLCNVDSIIFEDDGSYSLYTNNEEGICNYVIFGTYDLDEEESTVTLYVEYGNNSTILLGTIEDVQVENGEFSGTINFDDLCVQVVDGYEEADYTEALTYIPDDNLEQWLVDNGYDNQMDDYMLTSNAVNQSIIAISATDNGYDENGVYCNCEGDDRWSDRLTSLAGIEAFPNIEILTLTGNKLDSINITQNSQMQYFYSNFNSFYKVDTSGNPYLKHISIDGNELIPELDFSQNTQLTGISTPGLTASGILNEGAPGFIGEGGYYDISHLSQLEFLDLFNNNFTSVDLSGNPNLQEVRLHWNDLTSIDLSNNTLLESLAMPGNDLQGTLDVSMCENLMSLNVSMNFNLTCIKVNQTQLDNINNPTPEFEWEYPSNVTISLDCN